ncbi:hypothetical protein PHYPSEUDO_006025 [Phytophthora pseudosyringae]|uniref:Uncharacterized protein n=1 Tax=Phytophthora pseudosyringae TaxID=221518 RepID=A0A8T1VJK8_9STRA|nr:hypothetical protein PHYPSEUDO_006025 [Phytophthora pseudosyringae]
MPLETRHPGDRLAEYTGPFVCGDHEGFGRQSSPIDDTAGAGLRGYRRNSLAHVHGGAHSKSFGNRCENATALWHMLSSYKRRPGSLVAPTRSRAFNDALPGAIRHGVGVALRQHIAATESSRAANCGTR